MRWTSKLIRRDIIGLAAEYTGRLKDLLRSPAGMSAPTVHILIDIETMVKSENLRDITSTSSELSLNSFAADDCVSTAPTEVMGQEVPSTLYGLLSIKLKKLYASRVRDTPLEERWRFRGSWLLLDMATQYCASNPIYDIHRDGQPVPSEAALLLEVLRESTLNTIQVLLIILCRAQCLEASRFTYNKAQLGAFNAVHEAQQRAHSLRFCIQRCLS
jgi:hypothetical protein